MRQHRTPGESRVLAGPQSLRVRGGTQMLRTELLSPRAPQPETQPPPGEAGASPPGPSSRSNSHCPNAEGAGAASGPPRPQHPPASGRAEGPEPSPGCRQNKATGLAQVPRPPASGHPRNKSLCSSSAGLLAAPRTFPALSRAPVLPEPPGPGGSSLCSPFHPLGPAPCHPHRLGREPSPQRPAGQL